MSNTPKAQKKNHEIEQFGEKRVDPYHWLRADNWQQVLKEPDTLDSEIRNHLEADNAHFEAHASEFKDLQEMIFQEIKGRMKEDDSSIPAKDGEYEYWKEFRKGGQYPTYKRRHISSGKEEILFDGDTESKGKEFFNMAGISHNPRQDMIAYVIDDKGSEFFDIRFRNPGESVDYDEVIEKTGGNAIWSEDSSSIFFIELDDDHKPKRVKCHVIGTDPKNDKVIYEEKEEGYFISVDKTESGNFGVIHIGNGDRTENLIFDTNDGVDAKPKMVSPRREGHEYYLSDQDGYFYIRTNKDGASTFKVMRTPVDKVGEENWEEVVPHDPSIDIIDIETFKNYMVRFERDNNKALARLVVVDKSGKERIVGFEDQAYALGYDGGLEYDTDNIRISYETPRQPGQTFELNLKSFDKKLLKEKEVPSGHNADDYIVERIEIDARDGEKVPVTILRHKDTKTDGKSPLYLYGYGSYGHSMPAGFNLGPLSLADRGIIYAVAHIRGGADKGQEWHINGKMEHKQNTFNDFVDAADRLTDAGYGKKGEVIIHGGSAGGMLVGASVNMRPDLFGGVIAQVPFVDVLNTISDKTLPLTPPEWVEWGNPITDKQAYERMKSYSPYDNIQKGVKYPPIFASGGLTDYRVTYWEPSKWIARLRDEAEGGPFYSKINMTSGHSGASGRFDSIKERAENYAFAINQLDKFGYDLSLRRQARPVKNSTPKAPGE